MPRYEYRCTSCGDQLEVVQSFTDEPLTVCAACGGGLRKVFSPVGVVFKGSGFYRTDSRTKTGKSDAKPDGKPDAKPTTEGGAPAAKPDSAGKAAAAGDGAPSPGGGGGSGRSSQGKGTPAKSSSAA